MVSKRVAVGAGVTAPLAWATVDMASAAPVGAVVEVAEGSEAARCVAAKICAMMI